MNTLPSAADLFSVHGIVAVVTGGGSGLGSVMSQVLARNGAKKVYILGRRKHVLEDVVHGNPDLNNIIPIACDVANRQSLKDAVDYIEKDTGYIDLLVANSGVGGPSGIVPLNSSIHEIQQALLSIPMEDFTQTYHINCTAVFYTTIAFLHLLHQGNNIGTYSGGRSQVIATSSISGFNRGIKAGFAYATSKAATTMMLKVMATYLSPHKIRSNILCPGHLTIPLLGQGDSTVVGTFPTEMIPAERSGLPEDIMGALLYLTSKAGAYCNGNCVVVDGGRLSVTPASY